MELAEERGLGIKSLKARAEQLKSTEREKSADRQGDKDSCKEGSEILSRCRPQESGEVATLQRIRISVGSLIRAGSAVALPFPFDAG